MALTAVERRKLRGLLRKAEFDFCCPHCGATAAIDGHLIEQSPALKKRDGGAKSKGDDILLEGLEYNVRVIMRDLKLKRAPAILWVATSIMHVELKGYRLASTPKQLADRWGRKLHKAGYDNRPFETLKPQGVLIPLLKSLGIFSPTV